MIRINIAEGFRKILAMPAETQASVSLAMAQNESESCVVSLLADESLEGVTIVCDGLPIGMTVETEKEHFLDCDGVLWPDPLAPVSSFDVAAGELTNILVRFTTKVDTEAGVYAVTLTVRDGSGKNLATFDVEIKVWDFALPEGCVIESAVGLNREWLAKMHGVEGEELQALYEAYYEFLLRHRLSAYDLPYDPLDPRADRFMSDPRVTSFVVNSWAEHDVMKAYEAKIGSNPVWSKKATFYPYDEPYTHEHMGNLINRCTYLKDICPSIRRVSPFFTNVHYDGDRDFIDNLIEQTDVLCPKLACYNDEFLNMREPELTKEKPSFHERMTKAQAEGSMVWQYVCWEPAKPYTNVFVNESGLDHRILFWQQHLVGAQGFLYWSTSWWNALDDPWTSMVTVPELSMHVFGDGSLLYNGNKVGIDGPCGSVRLEAVRDGLEDCEMLRMATDILGHDWVMDKVKEVTTDLLHYTESEEVFSRVRREIGDALEAALAK